MKPVPPQGIAPAISKAESNDLLSGIPPLQKDSFDFIAAPGGRYLWFCGVPSHGLSGMWTRFVVSGTAKLPSVNVR